MSRKDFVLISRVIKQQRDDRNTEHDQILNSLAYAMATEINSTNSRFDRQKFLRACGCPNV